uniref:hypothetical protein n=1 Tax=Ruminococcus flavefaciens TaxID=1265 RepID=UPI00056177B1
MENNITVDEAFELIDDLEKSGKPITQEAVESIVSKLSVVDNVVDSNATTILYTSTDKLPSSVFDQAFENSKTMRYIGHTEAYNFLESNKFNSFISSQLRAANPTASNAEISQMVKDYMGGAEIFENFQPTGIKSNGTTGAWADVSRRFAAETTGDVVAYIGDIDDASSRIWWNTEMPEILERSGATSVNGVAIDDYRFLYTQLEEQGADKALDRVCRTIGNVPADNINSNYLDDVAVYFDETGKIIDIDPAPLETVVTMDPDTLEDIITKKEAKSWWEANASSRGSYKSTSELLETVDGNIDDLERLVSSVNAWDDAEDSAELAMSVLKSTNNENVDDAIDILSRSGND